MPQMPATRFVHNAGAVGRLKTCTQFEIKPDGSSTEWFQLRSTMLSGKQLFLMLQAAWPAIVGPEYKKYALIHCTGGPHAGVWFHLLPSEDYEPGCHEVASF